MHFKSFVQGIKTHADLYEKIGHLSFNPFHYYILSAEQNIWKITTNDATATTSITTTTTTTTTDQNGFTAKVYKFLQISDDVKITFIDRLYILTYRWENWGLFCNMLCRIDLFGKYYVFAELKCTNFLEVFEITFIRNPFNVPQLINYSSEVMRSLHKFLREDGYKIENEAVFHWPRKSWLHVPTLYHLCKETLYDIKFFKNFQHDNIQQQIPQIVLEDMNKFIKEKNIIERNRKCRSNL